MSDLTFLEVQDRDLLEKVFAFRYIVFKEIYPEYIKKLDIQDAKEYDEYDPYSIHFAGLNAKGEVCATVRLIHHSPIGYPTEDNANFDNSMFEREKLGEMSRIFVDKKYRSIKTTKVVIEAVKRFMFIKMMKEGVEYTYGYLEESFLRLLRIYKMPYHSIGENQRHEDFGPHYPCILYTQELGRENPEYFQLWEQQKDEE